MVDDLPGQAHVIPRPLRHNIIKDDGFAETRRFAEFDVSADDGVIYPRSEVVTGLVHNLPGEIQPGIEHREQHALDTERRIQLALDQAQRIQQLADALQRIVFALNGNEDGAGSGERIEGQQAQGGRTIDQQEIVVFAGAFQRDPEAVLPGAEVDHFDFGAGEAHMRRGHVQEGNLGFPGDVGKRNLLDEYLVDAGFFSRHGHAKAAGGVGLRIQVDEQRLLFRSRQAGGQVDRGCGLSDAAFLVGNGNDPWHRWKTPGGVPGYSMAACAAARRAIGTRYGEHET